MVAIFCSLDHSFLPLVSGTASRLSSAPCTLRGLCFAPRPEGFAVPQTISKRSQRRLAEILWTQPQKAAPWFRGGAPCLKCPDTQGRKEDLSHHVSESSLTHRFQRERTRTKIHEKRRGLYGPVARHPRHPGKTTTTNGSPARSGIKSSPGRNSVNLRSRSPRALISRSKANCAAANTRRTA
jgi:hypothetical protein